MRINIRRGREIAVSQPLLNHLHRDTVCEKQTGARMPLRYNYDKPEKPRISRVFGYLARFFILFQTEKSSREVVISYAVLKNTSPHNYALFMAARDLCDKTEAVTMADLAEPEVIDPEALRLIVNATLIARYGLAAFQIRARGADYER